MNLRIRLRELRDGTLFPGRRLTFSPRQWRRFTRLARRGAAGQIRLRDELLAALPWETPDGGGDWMIASDLSEMPGDACLQVTSWLRRAQGTRATS